MCSQPSRPSHNNHVGLFDTNRKTLHHNHKFATGDLSQVCDGRNWEMVRHSVEGESGTPSEGEPSDPCPLIGSGSSSAFTLPMMTQTQDNKAPQPQCTPYPLEEVVVEKGVVPLIQVSSNAKPESQDKQSLTTASTRRSSRPQTRRSSNEETVRSSDQLPRRRKPSRRVSAQSKSFTSSSQRPPFEVEATVSRKSSSFTTSRRHSSEDEPSTTNRERLALEEKKPPRRLSVDSSTIDSNTTSTSSRVSGDSRVNIRKLSEPMHRCSTTNQNVSGIMRRARYSSNNLAAMASSPAPSTPSQVKINTRPNFRRNASLVNLSSMKTWSDDELDHVPPVRNISVECFQRLKTINPEVEMEDMSDAHTWIASGVDFSKNMEVYLFKA